MRAKPILRSTHASCSGVDESQCTFASSSRCARRVRPGSAGRQSMGYESEYFRLHMAFKSGLVEPWGLGVIVRRGRPS